MDEKACIQSRQENCNQFRSIKSSPGSKLNKQFASISHSGSVKPGANETLFSCNERRTSLKIVLNESI